MHPCKSFKLFLASLTSFEVRQIRRARQQSKEVLLEKYLRTKGITDLQTLKNVNFHMLTQELERMQSPLKHNKISYKAFLRRKSSFESVTREERDPTMRCLQISRQTDNHTGLQTTSQERQNQILLGSQSTSQLDKPNLNWHDLKDNSSILSPHTPVRKSQANGNNTQQSLHESQEIQTHAIKSVENYRKSIRDKLSSGQAGVDLLVRKNTKQAEKPRSSFFALKETNEGFVVSKVAPEENKIQIQNAKVQEIYNELQGQDTRKSAIETNPHSDQRWVNNLFDYHKYEETSPSKKNLESSPTTGTDLSSEQFGTTKACDQVYLPEQTQFQKSDTFNKSGNVQDQISAIDEIKAIANKDNGLQTFESQEVYKRKSTIAPNGNQYEAAEPVNAKSQFKTNAITSTYSESRIPSPCKHTNLQNTNNLLQQYHHSNLQNLEQMKSQAFIPQGELNSDYTKLAQISPYKLDGYDDWNVYFPLQTLTNNQRKSLVDQQRKFLNQTVSAKVSPNKFNDFGLRDQNQLENLHQNELKIEPLQNSNEQYQTQLINNLQRTSVFDHQKKSQLHPILANFSQDKQDFGFYPHQYSLKNANEVSAINEVNKSPVQSHIPNGLTKTFSQRRDTSPKQFFYNPQPNGSQLVNSMCNPEINSILAQKSNFTAVNNTDGINQALLNSQQVQNLPRQSILDTQKLYLAQNSPNEIASTYYPPRQTSPDKALGAQNSNLQQFSLENIQRMSLIEQQINSFVAPSPINEELSPVKFQRLEKTTSSDEKSYQLQTVAEQERRKSFINSVPIAFLTEKNSQTRKSNDNTHKQIGKHKKDFQDHKTHKRKTAVNQKRKSQAKAMVRNSSPVSQTINETPSHSLQQNLLRNSAIESIRKSLIQSVPDNMVCADQVLRNSSPKKQNFDVIMNSDRHQHINNLKRKSTAGSQRLSFGTPLLQQKTSGNPQILSQLNQSPDQTQDSKSMLAQYRKSLAQATQNSNPTIQCQLEQQSPEKLIGYDNMNIYCPQQQTLEHLRQQSAIDQQVKSIENLISGEVTNLLTRQNQASPANKVGNESAQQCIQDTKGLESRRQSGLLAQKQQPSIVKSNTITDRYAQINKSILENSSSFAIQKMIPLQTQSSIKEFRKSQALFSPNEITNTYSKTRQVSPMKTVSFNQSNKADSPLKRKSVVQPYQEKLQFPQFLIQNSDPLNQNLPESNTKKITKEKSVISSHSNLNEKVNVKHQLDNKYLTLGKSGQKSQEQSDFYSSNSKTNSNQFSPENIIESKQNSPNNQQKKNRRKRALRSRQQSPLIVKTEPDFCKGNEMPQNSYFVDDQITRKQPKNEAQFIQDSLQQPPSFRQQNFLQEQEEKLRRSAENQSVKDTESPRISLQTASNLNYGPPTLPGFERSSSLIGNRVMNNTSNLNSVSKYEDATPPGILRSSSLIFSQSSPIHPVRSSSNAPIINEPKFGIELHNTLAATSPEHNTSITKSGFSSPATQYYTPFTGQEPSRNFQLQGLPAQFTQSILDINVIPNYFQDPQYVPRAQGQYVNINTNDKSANQLTRNTSQQVLPRNENSKQVGSFNQANITPVSAFNVRINVEIDNNGRKQSWSGGNLNKVEDTDLERQLKRKILSNPEEPLDRELIRKLYFQIFCTV